MQPEGDIDDITVTLSDNSDDTITPFNKFSNHITTNHQLDDIVFQRNQTNKIVLCKEHSATSTRQTANRTDETSKLPRLVLTKAKVLKDADSVKAINQILSKEMSLFKENWIVSKSHIDLTLQWRKTWEKATKQEKKKKETIVCR